MQHCSPVRYGLDHEGQLPGMVVLAVCIRARWVIHTPCVRPLLHWTGVYPGVPGYTPVQWSNGRQKVCPPSGALGGKVGSGRFVRSICQNHRFARFDFMCTPICDKKKCKLHFCTVQPTTNARRQVTLCSYPVCSLSTGGIS